LTETFLPLWAHVLRLGNQYGVNAPLFAALYLAHHPLFWGTMAWLAARVRRGQPVRGVVALGVFFWLMPYAYIFLFGHGLPWWAYGVGALALAVGGTHVGREVRRRLRASGAAP